MKIVIIAIAMVAAAAAAQSARCNPSRQPKSVSAVDAHWEKLKTQPDQALVAFHMAGLYAEFGHTDKALAALQKSLASDPWLDASQDPAFKDVAGCPEFQKLIDRVQKKYPPVANSEVVLTVGPKDLLPEGIAIDSHDGTMYLSSIFHKKIVKIGPDKRVSDFVSEGQDGLLSVLGLKVDARDRCVWAASERSGQAVLYHFSRSGKLLGKYRPKESGEHLFNDIIVTRTGDVYVTDSKDQSVYHLAPKNNELSRISLGDRLYPNGIALSADEKTIYIAHAFGIATMDRANAILGELQAPPGISIGDIDGLYCWHGKLIAIQNGAGGNRIAQFDLARDGRSITGSRLLEWRTDNLQLPTTGAIYDGWFYFMVNTQIDHDQDGKLVDPEHLQPVKVARIKVQ